MGYVSAIKPFSTLLAEKKCTTKGSSNKYTNAITHTKLNGHIKMNFLQKSIDSFQRISFLKVQPAI